MASVAGTAESEEVGLFLVPRFSMMAFTCAIEPLRAANRLSGRQLYRWKLISADGAAVEASNGIAILPHLNVADAAAPGIVAVCASIDAHAFDDRRSLAWLRSLAKHNGMIGAHSTGTWVLAKAGLLEGRRCTIHWEELPSFAEAYPRCDVTANLYEIDGNRFTCSGGTAGLDLMLHMIGARHGHDLAAAVSEQFIHTSLRGANETQRMTLRQRLRISHPRLLAAVAMMESRIEEPLSPRRIAGHVGLSTRQLERLFGSYLGHTPSRHYLNLRLDRAFRLLSHTALSVMEVALACGFTSAPHFARAFRARFDTAPREVRLPAKSTTSSGRAAAAGMGRRNA